MQLSGGFISIYRKILNWEWYEDINVCRVFIHLLLTANFTDRSWQGIEYKRGQVVTSREKLAKETTLSVQAVRTALKKLKSTGEITIKVTNKYTIITIVKYGFYQDLRELNNQQIITELTSEQPASNQQITTNQPHNNKDNNDNKEINSIYTASENEITKATAKASKRKYGEYKHVLLKDEELQSLKNSYPNYEQLIAYLDEYIEMKGYKAKSHYLAIKKWVVDAVKRENSKDKTATKDTKKSYKSYSDRNSDNLDNFYDNLT